MVKKYPINYTSTEGIKGDRGILYDPLVVEALVKIYPGNKLSNFLFSLAA
jgi:hypothetical protein